jgi:hypothetical protein
MSQYKYIINKRTGQQAIVPTNLVASLKSGVATYTSLPLTGNAIGDSRVANDTGHLYVWQKDSPTGLLTDWGDAGDFIDFTWDAISGKPSLTQLHDKNEDTKLDEGGVNETTVADVKVAVTQKHDTNKDQYLDYGGANQIAVTEVTKKLTSDKTYYINCDTGSNSNPGTSGSPFQTIAYAISLLPKNLNGYTVTIRLQNSLNYSEAIGTELNGFCGGRLEIRSDTSNPDNVLITLPIGSSKKEIILIEKTSAYILINRLSFRVNANNKRCISLGTNINSEIYGNKFGDNGNTGTTGVYLTSSEAKIQNCSDIDSNKVAVGIEVKAGSIAVITDSIFGDVNFPVGVGAAGSVYLVTNAADGKLFIHANTYNDVVNRVHTIDTDQYLDYGGGNQTQVTEIAKKMVTSKTVYVDGTNGDDSNPGTETLPYKTIGVALYNRPYMGVMNNSLTISIKAGTYDLTDVANVVYFGGAVGAGRLLIEAYLGQTVIIEGGANPPFSFNKVGHPVRIKGLSFRIKSDNVNCLGILDCTGRFQLSGVKFGDNWNTGTKGVIVDNSTVEIETCTDLDTNKVATGIEVVNGGIAIVVPESTSFGDTPYANSGGGVILKGASLCISQNDYESAIDLKHAPNSDNQTASEVPTDETGISVQDKLDEIIPGHTHTFTVAASDSSAQDKLLAGYVCDGTDDQEQIQAAIDALPVCGGKIKLTVGTFNISETIDLVSNMAIEGERGTKIIATDEIGETFNEGLFSINGKEYLTLKDFTIACEESVNSIAIKIFDSKHIDISNLNFNYWLGDENIYAQKCNWVRIIHCTALLKTMFAKFVPLVEEVNWRNSIIDCSLYFEWNVATYDVNTLWIQQQDEFNLMGNWIVPGTTSYNGVYIYHCNYTNVIDNWFATPLTTTNLLYTDDTRWDNIIGNNFEFGKIHLQTNSDARGYFSNNILCYGATETHNDYTDVILYADVADAITKKHSPNTDTALDTDKLMVGEDGKVTIASAGGYGANFLTGGTPSADSEYPEVGWLIPYAFDGIWVVPGWSSSVTDFPHWLKYDLGVGVSKIARKIKIITLFEPNAYLKTVQIQGSNDDSSWTTIETIVLANNGNAQEFEFANENSYRYYRFYCVDSWSAAKNATIIEVELYEADALEDKLQVNGNAIIKGTISDGTNTSSLVGIKDAIDKKHLPGSDNQTAAEISTDETGETVQDELDELNQHVNSANDPHKEKRVLIFKVLEDDELLTTGDGKFRFVIPSTMAGMNLIEAHVHIYTESSSGLPEIQIQNQTQAQNMLSVPITIDAGEYDSKNATTLPTIDTSNDDVDDGDIISVDCDGEGTGALGLEVRLTFQKP